MTQQTITAFFDNRSDATQAVEQLLKAGIPRTSIKLMPEKETSSSSTAVSRSSYDAKRDEKGFWESLGDFFMPNEDRYTYAEAMNRGDIMVSATVEEAHAARAEDILEEHGTVNIDEREASWRKEGWQGYTGTASPGAAREATGGDEKIPVYEEQLKVGKRQVSKGRVKVRSYAVETPVSEQVSLRKETVRVERRPVDRAVTDADSGRMFKDRTVEAEERNEVAVVSKEARVKEEVSIGKTAEQRTQTVQDKVRHTEVEVDDDRTGGRATKTDRQAGRR